MDERIEVRSRSLKELNRQAERHLFSAQENEFSEKAAATELAWAPAKMSPLYYLPSFSKLPSEVKLRYNQLFALGILEQFIWFEGELLGKILTKILGQTPPGEFRTALVHFLEDEEKHSEMFWQILEATAPELYPQRKFRYFNLNWAQQKAIQFLVQFPERNLAWVWMAIFFEERTLDYSQQYIDADRTNPGTLAPQFVTAHRLHYLDEARHFQMDLHFLENIYDRASSLQRKWSGFLMRKLIQSYTSPRRVTHRLLGQLQSEFPQLEASLIEALQSELRQIRFNRDFLRTAFGSKAVPRSRELMMRYPEMRGLIDLMGRN